LRTRWNAFSQDAARHHLDARGRIEWLTHHLGLYIGRFSTFAGLQSGDVTGLREHALFAAVEVGTERLDRELRGSGAPAKLLNQWQLYLAALDVMRGAPRPDNAGALRAAVGGWQGGYWLFAILTRSFCEGLP
jgi:hypothetical protein